MNKVYFSKQIEPILGVFDFSKLGQKVGIKVHFGEAGCTTYIDPGLVRKVYGAVVATGREAALVECNVLYKGSRTNSADHIKTAREHGFDLPIDILDGEDGSESVDWDGCRIGKGIERYDSLLVLSHFKGHMAAGFGGAIKNLAMGLGSRAGKLDMHSGSKPLIGGNCIGCGICVENCQAEAISLVQGKAVIDQEKCEGCAMCIAVCRNGAVRIPWQGRTEEGLQARMAEYARAILKRVPRTVYINVLRDITVLCDCMNEAQTPVMPDIGILYSDSLVPIEKASLDLANRHSGGKFDAINLVDKSRQITLAEKAGLGDSAYDIVEI